MPGAAKANNAKLLDCLAAGLLVCLVVWLLDAPTTITRGLILLTIMFDGYLVDLLAQKTFCHGQTDGRTDRRTFAFLELLSQLKIYKETFHLIGAE